jgi:hypothetical protein
MAAEIITPESTATSSAPKKRSKSAKAAKPKRKYKKRASKKAVKAPKKRAYTRRVKSKKGKSIVAQKKSVKKPAKLAVRDKALTEKQKIVREALREIILHLHENGTERENVKWVRIHLADERGGSTIIYNPFNGNMVQVVTWDSPAVKDDMYFIEYLDFVPETGLYEQD